MSKNRNIAPAAMAKRPTLDKPGTNSLAGWFLGPKAENQEAMHALISRAFEAHCQDRKDYMPGDPVYVTDDIKASAEYQDTMSVFGERLDGMLHDLRGSIPLRGLRRVGPVWLRQ